jgi:hypothetical protein
MSLIRLPPAGGSFRSCDAPLCGCVKRCDEWIVGKGRRDRHVLLFRDKPFRRLRGVSLGERVLVADLADLAGARYNSVRPQQFPAPPSS